MMMFQNEKTTQRVDQFSLAMQRRMDSMLRNADKLFSMGWLRKRLWKELAKRVNEEPATEFGNYAHVLRGSYESCFIYEFLHVYKKSLQDIRKKIEYAFEGTNPMAELLDEREELIREFARMPLSRSWEYVKDDDQSWRNFARRMPLNESSKKEDISLFFEMLDRICLITDIVCGHAKEYGLEIDSNAVMPQSRQTSRRMTDDVLIKAVNRCSSFLVTQSAWAVVYCVLRDDYGYYNMSQFERDIEELPLKASILSCPKDTISSTLKNNAYMKEAIDKWPASKKYTKFANELRAAIEEELAK